MLAVIRPRWLVVRSWLDTGITERTALLVMAGSTWLSFMLWIFLLVAPFNLYALWHNTQVSIYGLSFAFPGVQWSLTVLFVLQTGLYLLSWAMSYRAGGRDAWTVLLWGSVASSVALLFVYPIASTDIFDYINHGRLWGIYGLNPFTVPASRLPGDYFYPYVGWPHATSAYGPLWELAAAPLARLVGRGLIPNVLAFKLLSAVFYWGSLAVLVPIMRRVAPARLLPAVLLLAWNPLVLYETFANGHNDIVMIFFMLVAVLAMLARRYTAAILALLVGGLVKFIPVLMIPAAGLLALRDLPDLRSRIRFVLVTGLLGVLLVAASYAPFWTGPEVLSITRREQLYTTSLPSVFFAALAPLHGAKEVGSAISRIALLLTVGFTLVRALLTLRDHTPYSFARASFETLMFYLLVAVPWFMPWYALWPLALAVVLPPGRGLVLALIFAVSALLQPVLFGPLLTWRSPPARIWQQLGLAVTTFGAAWAYVLAVRSPSVEDLASHESGSTGYLV
jgi:hypothetical protein